MSLFIPDLTLTPPRQEPLQVASETFVIRALTPSVGGTWTNLNAMLIRAAEPVIVDTGMVTSREQWFADLFSLVAPDEVRWIFITHNDSDHSGNMVEALQRCPNAKLVTSRGEAFRCAASFGISYERMHMVDPGETFDAGDRTLRAVRPPVYDSPYTRGLFDHSTGVYYASDAFCAPNPEAPVDWVEDIDPSAWATTMAQFHLASLCPWIGLVEPAAFQRELSGLEQLGIAALVSAHAPAMRGRSVRQAFANLARLPEVARAKA
ncbi:oxygen-binding di-iron domain-containing protein [Novosphingobium malaysiense]|uniref:MBL fold metallo-hydrolase n=1 Tax=Novosphingobium malaysiense TaxID=1348853 RepID=UPI0006919190|nr:MBL fold metallo-hydrolase [Novosphingobium malaysiense]